MSGVESTGFVTKTLDEITDELITNLRADIGQDLELTVNSPEGQLMRVFARALSEIWNQGKAVYDAFDPAAAFGASLENLSSVSGTVRKSATQSTVTATLNIDAGRTVPAGSIVSVDGNPDARFVLLADAENTGGSPDDFPGRFEAEVTGSVVANTGTLTVIETPVTGWNSVTNPSDAVVGTDIETDEELRLRREQELAAVGSSSFLGLLADIRQVPGVTDVLLFENETDVTVNGLPSRSFEAVVLGGADEDLAEAIFGSKPLGIQAFGSTTLNVDDGEGLTHPIGFTRATPVTLHAQVTVLTNSNYPVDGDAQIKEAVRASIDARGIGDDVILASLFAPILAVPGVIDVTEILLDTVDPPVAAANAVIDGREIAAIDTSNIDLVTT